LGVIGPQTFGFTTSFRRTAADGKWRRFGIIATSGSTRILVRFAIATHLLDIFGGSTFLSTPVVDGV
jgi:hypothetical protein